MSTDRQLADKTVKSLGYQLTVLNPVDRAKVNAAREGVRKPSPGAALAQVAWDLYLREPPPKPPLPSIQELGRNVMFTAQNPEAALRCPKHWKIAVTADPGPEGKWDQAVRAAGPKIQQAGHPLAVWGVQTQVGAKRIRELAAELHADFVIFQAETPAEYDSAMVAGAQLIIANPNGWTETQRADAKLRGDKLATLFEVYANAGSPWPDTASSQGVPVSCEVLGVGSWEGRPDVQLADYQPRTPAGVWQTMSVYLAENMSEESWGLLP